MTFGRFATCAWPWFRLGANTIPIVPGGKSPAIDGFGKRAPKSGNGFLSTRLGLEPDVPLNVHGSPQIPWDTLAQWGVGAFRDYNCAVFPGTIGALVVDIDDISLLEPVLRVCGDTPYRTISGREGGGVHLWYRGLHRSTKVIPGRVDVKSEGGYVLTPGALHAKSGRDYTASPELAAALAAGVLDLPPITDGWFARVRALGRGLSRPTRVDLGILADDLQSRTKTRTIAKVLRAIADGRAFAEPGERDEVLYRALVELAVHWPRAETAAIVDLFRASAATMESAHPVDLPILDAVAAKWERVSAQAVARIEDSAADEVERSTGLRREAWTWVGALDCEEPASVADGPLCVHLGTNHFLRIGDQWAGPFRREQLSTGSVLRPLEALYGVELPDAGVLLGRYATRASSIRESFVARSSGFDRRTGVLVRAAAPLDPQLVPERSPEVEQWIRVLGGEYHGHLSWWLAGLLRPELSCRALVLSGLKNTSKSAFLRGLNALWPGGAAKMSDVVGKRFNAAMAQSWLAISDDDENTPAESGGSMAAFLRQAVSERVQRIERKHMDVSVVEGSLRFALATNDPYSMVSGAVDYNANAAALDAFGDRLLHVPVPDSARYWWEREGVDLEPLIEGGGLARHVLWLDSLVPKGFRPADRFWCDEAEPVLAKMAVFSSGLRGEVATYLIDALDQRGSSLRDWRGVPAEQWGIGEWLAVDREDPDAIAVHGPGLLEALGQDRPRGATKRTIGIALGAMESVSGPPFPRRAVRLRRISRGLLDTYRDKIGI